MEKEEEIKVTLIEKLLEANTGKEVKITFDEKTLTGKIKALPEDKSASFIIVGKSRQRRDETEVNLYYLQKGISSPS